MTHFQCGSTKYTSKPLTLNGVTGRLWTKWEQQSNGAWAHSGKAHVCKTKYEEEVMNAFDDAFADVFGAN